MNEVHIIYFLVMFSDADRYEMQAVSMASPMKSPHRYSPSVYSHQVRCTKHTHSMLTNYNMFKCL